MVNNSEEGLTVGKIVETEAYIGPKDAGSHAYKGKRTKRTEIQFNMGGFAYIYQIYGFHFCFNIVTQNKDMPEVVLIRALEPVEGLKLMERRRGINNLKNKNIVNLTNGPGKLCKAMGIDKSHYGLDLCNEELYLSELNCEQSFKICSTPRINIDYAGEAKEYPWRFYIENNEYVSK